jgi:hypothetical protein
MDTNWIWSLVDLDPLKSETFFWFGSGSGCRGWEPEPEPRFENFYALHYIYYIYIILYYIYYIYCEVEDMVVQGNVVTQDHVATDHSGACGGSAGVAQEQVVAQGHFVAQEQVVTKRLRSMWRLRGIWRLRDMWWLRSLSMWWHRACGGSGACSGLDDLTSPINTWLMTQWSPPKKKKFASFFCIGRSLQCTTV